VWHKAVYSLLINLIVNELDLSEGQDSHEMLYAFDGSEFDPSVINQVVKLREKG